MRGERSAARVAARAPIDAEARLAELARSRGALRRVLAGLAEALIRRNGWERLGYARVGDYARERLGLSGRSLHDLARVGRALGERPGLEAALVAGVLPWSKVRLLARFVGADDERDWIARSRRLSVRVLERRVRTVDRGALASLGLEVDEDGASTEPVETVQLRVGGDVYFRWRRTLTWAARVAGERVTPGAVLEMVTAETLSALPAGGDGPCDPAEGLCRNDGARVSPRGDGRAQASSRADDRSWASPRDARQDRAERQLEPMPKGREIHERDAEARDVAPATTVLPAFLDPLLSGLEQADAFELDARLRRAVRLEQRLDAQIAPLLAQVTASAYAWRTRPWSLAAFARERLGMSPRKARALLRLERLGAVCPALRAAFRDGALSWLQAQILAPLLLVDAGGEWRTAWLRFAERVTVRRLDEAVGRAFALREAGSPLWDLCRDEPERACDLEAGDGDAAPSVERQVCARSSDRLHGIRLRVVAPRDVARLFRAALGTLRRAMEAQSGRIPGEAEAFGAMIDHALASWGVDDPWLRRRARVGRHLAVFERDGWRCSVPGCTSQRSLQAHHIRFRSAGGGDESANLTTLCAAHHHRGVHAGAVRICGRAPDALWFELGVRAGQPPLTRYRSGDRVA
jgi:hypothetical protein